MTKISSFIVCCVLLFACSYGAPQGITVSPPVLKGAGNVQLLVFPDDDEQVLLDAIAAARQRVWMVMYLMTDQRVIESLNDAHINGADVRVLLEMHPYGVNGESNSIKARDNLEHLGIMVKPGNPAFLYTHEKSIVIDERAVILTANMTHSAFADNREFGLFIGDPQVVSEMADAFQADWDRKLFEPAAEMLAWSPNNARNRVNAIVNSASRVLRIYAEEVQDAELSKLLSQAVSRGVEVRMIVSPSGGVSNDDSGENGLDLDYLQRNSVAVRFLKKPYIHAKLYICDTSVALVGSVNYSVSSLEFNRELAVFVDDKALLSKMVLIFDNDWDAAILK